MKIPPEKRAAKIGFFETLETFRVTDTFENDTGIEKDYLLKAIRQFDLDKLPEIIEFREKFEARLQQVAETKENTLVLPSEIQVKFRGELESLGKP